MRHVIRSKQHDFSESLRTASMAVTERRDVSLGRQRLLFDVGRCSCGSSGTDILARLHRIRSSNKQAISEEVEREVPFFFRTKDADKLLQDTLNAISVEAAKEAMKELRKDDDKATEALQNAVYEDLKPTVEGLRGKIEELRVKVDVLLNGEEEDDDGLGKGGNITA